MFSKEFTCTVKDFIVSSEESLSVEMDPIGRFLIIKCWCISTSAAISPRSAGATCFHMFSSTLSCGSTFSSPPQRSFKACWTNLRTNGIDPDRTNE